MEEESTRQKKVSRLVLREVAGILVQKGRELAPGRMISVTRVRISPDLSFARIYISIFPSDSQDEVLETIRGNVVSIRYDLGQKVRSQLRIVPEIAFYIDDSLDYIEKIDKLLKS